MAAAASGPTPSPLAAPRWLFGPAADLLLGCGVGYCALFALLCLYGEEVRTGTSPGLIPFLTLLVGAPHYGATLLRVYERREDRRAYALFAVHASVLLTAAFVLATRSPWLGSLLITVYVTWSPWHYAGQNYGLAVMFLRRRGVALDATTKRLLYASFALSFALTFLVMHRERPAGPYAPTLYEGYRPLSLGIPDALASGALAVVGVAYAAAIVGAAVRLLRRSTARDLVPAALLVFTQALWFSIPVVARQLQLFQGAEPLSSQFSTYYFFYAALAHSVQYVWVTSYYARSASGEAGLGAYLGKALLAGIGIWTLPALLFAPDILGRLPFDAGLGALVAAVVNLHHFVLDGAIWKLRDGRIARVLIRSESAPVAALEPIGAARRVGLRPLAWAAGGVSLAIALVASYEGEFGVRRPYARGDAARVRSATERLDWIGRESASVYFQLGRLQAAQGDGRAALVAYERSIDLQPTAEAWVGAADVLERVGQLGAAEEALGHALDLAPDRAAIAYRGGTLAARRGEVERARSLLARAVALAPEKKLYRLALERAAADRTGSP